jgi:hypothetical protein
MKNLFFHGSCITGLSVLHLFSKAHNTIKESVAYLTSSYTLALFYIWNRPYKWVTYDVDENGVVTYTEWFQNQLSDFYSGVCGCIYECSGDIPNIQKTHMNCVFISDKLVPVTKSYEITDVYSEIIDCEREGKVRIKRYDALSNEEKQQIKQDTIRGIHMQKLLIRGTNISDAEKEEIKFIQDKFPIEWEIAKNNTQNEIDEMINAWKKSIGII